MRRTRRAFPRHARSAATKKVTSQRDPEESLQTMHRPPLARAWCRYHSPSALRESESRPCTATSRSFAVRRRWSLRRNAGAAESPALTIYRADGDALFENGGSPVADGYAIVHEQRALKLDGRTPVARRSTGCPRRSTPKPSRSILAPARACSASACSRAAMAACSRRIAARRSCSAFAAAVSKVR